MTDLQFPTDESIISKKQLVLFEVLDSGDMNYFMSLCKLVTDNVIINARDKRPMSEGRTLLHNISLCNHTNSLFTMKYLIDTGVDINAIDCSVSLRTPLMDAVATVNIEKSLYLIEVGADITRRDASGDNAFHYAAKTGIAMLIRKVIEVSICKHTSMQQIQNILDTPNVKKRLPEDMAANKPCKDLLTFIRLNGAFPTKIDRKIKKVKN